MFDTPFFQSVIALITIYLVFSQLTLSLVELPAGFLNTRGRYLYKHLGIALGTTARGAFYQAAAIKALMAPITKQNWLTRLLRVSRWPAYVSEALFAQTVIAWVSGLDAGASSLSPIARFQAGLNKLDAAVADAATALNAANVDVDKARSADQTAANSLAKFKEAAQTTSDPDTKATAALTVANATAEQTRTAQALSEAQVAQNAATTNLADAEAAVAEVQQFTSLLRPQLTAALAAAAAEPEQSQALQKNLEAWFHEFGERMTGWYKRDSRKYLLFMGLLVAVLADVDTVRLARFIFDANNAKARTTLVAAGVQAAQGAAPAGPTYRPGDAAEAKRYEGRVQTADTLFAKAYREMQTTLSAVPKAGLPLGWLRFLDTSTVRADTTTKIDPKTKRRVYAKPSTYSWASTADDYGMPAYAQRWTLDKQHGQVSHPAGWSWWWAIGGWLLTAFAMMLGAPFWFDTLCRFVNIRNVGIKPAASKPS